MPLLGLVGFPLTHSFSKKYFTEKFERENLSDFTYRNFEIENVTDIETIIQQNTELIGFNVTVPHKETIIPFLDALDETADNVGAVNTVVVKRKNKLSLIGYNTDVIGFEKSILPLLTKEHAQAIILGTGGSAKAVAYVLRKLKIPFRFVSRKPVDENSFSYGQLKKKIINDHKLIINTTPLGMFPNENEFPDIPYQHLDSSHLLFDLIYNPAETLFLKKGIQQNASTKNGLEMLHLQAEESWNIWKKNFD